MNNYPTWWDRTVTVFNRYEDAQGLITWYKTIVPNCFWRYVGDTVTIGETTLETNATLCRIPKSENFVEKYEWLSLEDKSSKFTLGVDDIIVLGEVEDTIDEYASGLRSSDLLIKYRKLQGCMKIEKCSINVGGGRGNEHYFVKGV